jgi:3-phosphoshikimate 1-carboxyvinyltransferase
MAALASGTSILTDASPSRDCEALIAALRALGVQVESPDATTIRVTGSGVGLAPYHGTIDVGPAGTTMRFLAALCAGIPGADIILRGSERMHARPIRALVDSLRQAGASIEYRGTEGCPPLRIHSQRPLTGNGLQIDGTTSSQFVSALLLASPLFSDGLELSICGKQISTSYIDMTLQGMCDFGIAAECSHYQMLRVPPGQTYTPRTYRVEGDASGASYLWAIAAVSGGSITVENINPASAQGDIRFPRLLEEMGCAVSYTANSITVSGTGNLRAIEANMELMPDTAQTLAVVAAFATGDTVIRGLQTLRIKETDRIAALHTELAKIGISSDPGPDYLVVRGGKPTGARIATYDDHRMAMSFAVCASAIDGVTIEAPEVVEKSLPEFWSTLAELGIKATDL